MLAVSRSNNSARGLTGMLLFHDGCFFQVLEGGADTLERTFATISRDTRHSATGSSTSQHVPPTTIRRRSRSWPRSMSTSNLSCRPSASSPDTAGRCRTRDIGV
ncbi:MAG: BLUF domain-containing protein [Hyphomonadaceae bacterium]|nr:BLUF domain-containing protein [Hyphomonadaceae bacterium]